MCTLLSYPTFIFYAAEILPAELYDHYNIVCSHIHTSGKEKGGTRYMKMLIFWELLAKIAWLMAKLGAGAASTFNNYQPNLPSKLSSDL